MKSTTQAAIIITLASLAAGQAFGASIRVQCEARGTDRAKVSIDGRDLAAGKYTTVAVSGGSMAASPAQAAVAGQVESDFDSNANDIRAGAVAIPSTFINNASVTGKIVDATGHTVIADTVSCRVRAR